MTMIKGGTGHEQSWIERVANPAKDYATTHQDEIRRAEGKYLAVHPTEGVIMSRDNKFDLSRGLPSRYDGEVLIEEKKHLLEGTARQVSMPSPEVGR